MSKKSLFLWLFSGFFLMITFSLSIIGPIAQKNMIDTSIKEHALSIKWLYILILIYSSIVITRLVSNFLSGVAGVKESKNFIFYFFYKVLHLKKTLINRNGSSFFYDILASDSENVVRFITSHTTFSFIFSTIQSLIILAIIFTWNKIIFFVVLSYLILISLVTLLASKIFKRIFSQIRENSSMFVSESIDKISNNFSIIHNSIYDKILERLIVFYNPLYKTFKKHLFTNISFESLTQTLNLLITLFIVVYSTQLVIKEELTYGVMIALLSYLQMAKEPVNSFKVLISTLNNADISIKRLLSLETFDTNECSYKLKKVPSTDIKSIKVSNLSFFYKEAVEKSYHNINFSLDSGCLALVGVSGEGKSTILNLLIGENTAHSGDIEYDEISEKQFNLEFKNLIFNIYSQNIEIFNKDLYFNLALGKSVIDKEEIEKIVEKIKLELTHLLDSLADNIENFTKIKDIIINNEKFRVLLHIMDITPNFSKLKKDDELFYLNFIKELIENRELLLNRMIKIEFDRTYIIKSEIEEIVKELGLQSLENRDFGENGNKISGGERQKIMLARFLLKKNWSFFILDEPLVNLDSINEKELLSLLIKYLKGKKGIIISHKFNLIKDLSDRVILIEDGHIKQRGKHQELININGKYKELYETFCENVKF